MATPDWRDRSYGKCAKEQSNDGPEEGDTETAGGVSRSCCYRIHEAFRRGGYLRERLAEAGHVQVKVLA